MLDENRFKTIEWHPYSETIPEDTGRNGNDYQESN